MGEVVNAIVAFAVIVFLFRWATSGSDNSEQRSIQNALGFRPKNVTQPMVDTISTMFPDIPPDNIRYDLLRTGSVELTTNKILERSYLEAPPPAYFTVFNNANGGNRPRAVVGAATTQKITPKETLISRYQLQDRAQRDENIKEEDFAGKATWEESPEKREANLRERKAKMILAARQRLISQQKEPGK